MLAYWPHPYFWLTKNYFLKWRKEEVKEFEDNDKDNDNDDNDEEEERKTSGTFQKQIFCKLLNRFSCNLVCKIMYSIRRV